MSHQVMSHVLGVQYLKLNALSGWLESWAGGDWAASCLGLVWELTKRWGLGPAVGRGSEGTGRVRVRHAVGVGGGLMLMMAVAWVRGGGKASVEALAACLCTHERDESFELASLCSRATR